MKKIITIAVLLVPSLLSPTASAAPVLKEQKSVPQETDKSFELNRWSGITAGANIGTSFGVNVQLFTFLGRHVKVTLIDSSFSWAWTNQVSFDWHAGSTVGFGGHHGSRRQFSHWALTGLWMGGRFNGGMFASRSHVTGLFLPVGYEFRHRFRTRSGTNLVWGVRAYVAYSPLHWSGVGATTCKDGSDSGFLCGVGEKIEIPIMSGVQIFVGF